MRRGVPYQGSKNSIAEWVVSNIPASPVFVDLFAGGCAVTHAALESGKFGAVVANDLTDAPDLFLQAVDGEWAEGGRQYEAHRKAGTLVPDRALFDMLKDVDPYVGLCYSFGNNRSQYLWGEDIERVKRAATLLVLSDGRGERYHWWMELTKALAEYEASGCEVGIKHLEGLQRLQGLQGLQGLQRLQGLQGLQGLQRLQVSHLDYRDVPIPEGACVYCDPPYRNTECRGYVRFDFREFDEWLAGAPFMAVVSEYECPPGCVEVACTEKNKIYCATDNRTKAHEGLFVQERFLGEYRERMGMLF